MEFAGTESPNGIAVQLLRAFGCVPVGMVVDEESYYNHSPPDFNVHQLAGLKKAFDRFDYGCDGSMDAMEIHGLLQYLGWDRSQQVIDNLIDDVDINSDGHLQFEEVLNLIRLTAKKDFVETGHPFKELSFYAFTMRNFPQIPFEESEIEQNLKKAMDGSNGMPSPAVVDTTGPSTVAGGGGDASAQTLAMMKTLLSRFDSMEARMSSLEIKLERS